MALLKSFHHFLRFLWSPRLVNEAVLLCSFNDCGPDHEVVYHAFPSRAESVSMEEVGVLEFGQSH